MIVDTSALVAILYREPEAASFVEYIHDAETARVSVANFVGLSMVVESQLGPDGMRQAEAFFRRAGIIIEPVTVEHGELGPLCSYQTRAAERADWCALMFISPYCQWRQHIQE